MNEEILNKLHTALYPISPLASDREKIIEEMGQTIWLESLEKILLVLDDATRLEVVGLLNQDDLDKAVALIETKDIDVEAVIAGVSLSLLEETLAGI